MDRFEAMRIFVAVAQDAGFAAAARRLRMSPPSVTRMISALELRIGARLLLRTTRVVRMTEAGERFFVEAKRILAELEDAEAAAAGSHRGLRGGLRITASVMFGRRHLVPIVLDFLAQHSDITARTLLTDRVVDLAEEGFDIAVRISHLADSSLRAVRVGAVRTVVCASPDVVRRHPRIVHPRDLEGLDAVGFHPTLGDPRWEFAIDGKRVLVAPRLRLIVNSTEVGIDAALAGQGLVRSLSYMVAPHVQTGHLVVLLAGYELPEIPVHLLLPEGRQAAARVRGFVEFASSRLRDVLGPKGPASLPAESKRSIKPRREPSRSP